MQDEWVMIQNVINALYNQIIRCQIANSEQFEQILKILT